MSAIRDWLAAHVPGYNDLSDREREVIEDFSVLWSVFEGKVLQKKGSASAIVDACEQLENQGRLRLQDFADQLHYFRTRYVEQGELSARFYGLHLRQNDNPTLVRSVLRNENNSVARTVAALLIIVYRFRNNLFHGEKWAYGIRDQFDNFTHANKLLMQVYELASP
jgi:hypothetical protein